METMINVFPASGYTTLGAVFIFIVITHVLIRTWRRHKFSSEGQRAIARLRSLEPKHPPEAVGPELTPRQEIEIDRADNSCLWSDSEQATNEKSLVHNSAYCMMQAKPGLTFSHQVAIEPSSLVTASRRRSSCANCESESSRAPMTTMRSPGRANLISMSPQASRSGKAKAFRPHRWISKTISSLPTLRSTVPPK